MEQTIYKPRIIKSAVVTGPTGAIGLALCQLLLDKHISVYAVCNPVSTRNCYLPDNENLHIVKCDLQELNMMPRLLEKKSADAFFHLAWAHTIGPGRDDMYAQIDNIHFTIDAVHAAQLLGCQVFIGAGSQAEYGRVEGDLEADTPVFPENGYGMAKLSAGQMSRLECHKYGIDHIWPRILSVYGPGDGERTMISTAIKQLLAEEKPSFTKGEQEWDYLFSRDAAKALYLMALYGKDGSIYPLGSGQTHKLRDYIETIRNQINPKLQIGIGDIPYNSKQVMYLKANIQQLHNDTGFKPEVSFEAGILETIEWIKNTL